MTGARKPDPRGDHEGNRKTIAQGMPADVGVPVVTCSCAFFLAREAMGASCTRHSLRPPLSEDVMKAATRTLFAPRECEVLLFDRLIRNRPASSFRTARMRRAKCLPSSCPRLPRASTYFLSLWRAKDVDGRVKPGHDDEDSSFGTTAKPYPSHTPHRPASRRRPKTAQTRHRTSNPSASRASGS
jgi:hypothetical protein